MTIEIDYAELGSDIEHDYDSAQCAAFATKYWQSTDQAMAELACYALFTAKAKAERLAGRIATAMVAERNADTVYTRNIKPENQW